MISADSNLPTNDDHNFKRYKGNFKRVIEKHSKKVKSYRENHKGYKLLFFVFDESSGIYFENHNMEEHSFGVHIFAEVHMYWKDYDFIEVIKQSCADYFIWYKPYHSFDTINGKEDSLPKVMVYKVDDIEIETKKYKDSIMESNEI